MILKKTNYEGDYFALAREQYKRLPNLARIFKIHGRRLQAIEDELFRFFSFAENYGTGAEAPRGVLNDTARNFGIAAPETLSEEDLRLEIKAAMIAAFSGGKPSDLASISSRLYDLESHVTSFIGGFEIAVYGDVSSDDAKRAKLIFKTASKMAPATTECFGVVEAQADSFGFERFGGASGLSSLTGAAGKFSKLVVGAGGAIP